MRYTLMLLLFVPAPYSFATEPQSGAYRGSPLIVRKPSMTVLAVPALPKIVPSKPSPVLPIGHLVTEACHLGKCCKSKGLIARP